MAELVWCICSEADYHIKKLEAHVAELKGLLNEACLELAGFIDNEHQHRDKYPHVMRKFENDMDIVRRIVAALERGKDEDL